MARDTDQLAGSFETEDTGGFLSGFLAEEDVFDRRALWRLGSWGAASVGAVILAFYANQSFIAVRRDQVAATDLARQSQQIQAIARESQSETRRLASAIDTLNGDRDRLYSRITVLEQGLDSVTGAIAKQNAVAASPQTGAPPAATAEPQQAAPPGPAPVPVLAPVTTTAAKTTDKPPTDTTAPEQGPAATSSVARIAATAPAASPATPLVAAKSMMAPPDAAATKLIEPEKPAKAITAAPMPEVVASVPPADHAEPEASEMTAPKLPVQRTEFGVDIGGANSVGGLRALWRGLLKSRSNAALTTLRPIIVVREGNNGLGMQLRLVAGPLGDAAAAAKICAALIESNRACETTVFDGQRLAIDGTEPAMAAKPAAAKPAARRRGNPKHVTVEEPPKKPDPPFDPVVAVRPAIALAQSTNITVSWGQYLMRLGKAGRFPAGAVLSRFELPSIFAV
jgi:hypothetical protein